MLDAIGIPVLRAGFLLVFSVMFVWTWVLGESL